MTLPRIDASRAVGAYAAVATVGFAWLAITAATAPTQRFDTIDVQRINVREPDGTLRMTIAGEARFPGLIIKGHEYRHDRGVAGMLFFNDEGSENGGLVFDGALVDGKPTNAGSLTFDRYHQDQTVQMSSDEDGTKRRAGFTVFDRPDRQMRFEDADRIRALPAGPARDAAATAAGFGAARRAYLGSTVERASRLDLGDGDGKPRLRLEVARDGRASIAFLDSDGRTTRTIGAP